jgi:REP element-mobilizing transposase RayT
MVIDDVRARHAVVSVGLAKVNRRYCKTALTGIDKHLSADQNSFRFTDFKFYHPHHVERYRYASRILHFLHTYGTWLHGDKRGSVDRFHNRYGSPRIAPNRNWQNYNRQALRAPPLILGPKERRAVKQAVRDTCRIRKWSLLAFSVRTNHVHIVVTAHKKAELVLNAFKANATRQLRQDGLWHHPVSPRVRKGASVGYGANKALPEPLSMCCTAKATTCQTLTIEEVNIHQLNRCVGPDALRDGSDFMDTGRRDLYR